MTTNLTLSRATIEDVHEVARLAGELLHEIMAAIGTHVFNFSLQETTTWLEVTTPPLPQFDTALEFYERQGFGITGGRKLKVAL